MTARNSHKKIRILHVLDCLGGGGVEEWLKNICLLSDRDRFYHTVYFYGYVYDSDLFDIGAELKKNGIEVIYKGVNLLRYSNIVKVFKSKTDSGALRCLRRLSIYLSLNLFSFFQLTSILIRGEFDVVHIHLCRLFLSGSIVARMFRKKVVYTVPGLKSQLDSYQTLTYFIYRYFNFLSDIFVTGASKRELVEFARIPKNKIKTIKASIDLREIRVIERSKNPILAEFNLFDSFPLMLSVGRMDPEKGHKYSIKTVKHLTPFFPNIKLIILGDGSDFRTTQESIDNTVVVRGRVILPGFRKDIENFHSIADVYLRTSIYEGGNMACIWAMAYGKPVIGFDTKQDTEVIINGENGILVPTMDTKKMSEAVKLLMDDAVLRKKIGRNAMGYAAKNCNIKEAIQTYEEIYNGLCKNLI